MRTAARRWAHRRRPHLALGCVAGGLLLAPAGSGPVAILAALAAAGATLAFGGRAALAAAALVVTAGCAGSARIETIDRPARAAPPGTVIDALATLLEPARPTRFGWSAVMGIDTGSARGLRVLARVDQGGWPAEPRPGLRVHVRGLVRDPDATAAAGRDAASDANAGRPGTPGYGPLPPAGGDQFDFAAFLRSRGIGRELQVESMTATGHRGGVAGALDGIRRRAAAAIATGLGPERAALARGMVLGDDSQVPDDVRDDFQRSGLAHLMAASGQNVALLCALVLPALMLGRAGPRLRIGALGAAVAIYVPLAGAGASVVRAAVMAGAALAATAAGRAASAAYALLLAATVTLAMNPRASADPGWQLSFAAVGGMLVLGPHLRRAFRGAPRPLAEGLAATCAATVATAPLMAHQFGAISLAALPANLAALPTVAPVMWIGMTQGAIGQLTALGVAAPLSDLGLRWVAGVARHFAQPAWAQADVRLSWPGVVAAYAGLAAVPLVARARCKLAATPMRERLLELLDAWRSMPRRARVRAAALVTALALALAATAAGPAGPPRRLTVDYLDIGQGDATLIRDPSGATVLFDGGPPEGRVDRLLHRLGVRRLSVVVATHQSRDHHGGLLQVVKRFPVDLFLDGGDGTADPTFLALEREVDRRGIPRVPTRRGQTLQIGAMTIRVLWPGPRAPGPAPHDPNPRATVAVVTEAGFSLFLSADAESGPLLPLGLPRVDAMKVPHHGSADPGLPRLLERLRPRVAGIEVGRGNTYGHPRPSTLAALRARVPFVYRTDRDGTIELSVGHGAIDVRTHR